MFISWRLWSVCEQRNQTDIRRVNSEFVVVVNWPDTIFSLLPFALHETVHKGLPIHKSRYGYGELVYFPLSGAIIWVRFNFLLVDQILLWLLSRSFPLNGQWGLVIFNQINCLIITTGLRNVMTKLFDEWWLRCGKKAGITQTRVKQLWSDVLPTMQWYLPP